MVVRQDYKDKAHYEGQLLWLQQEVLDPIELSLPQTTSESKKAFLEESLYESYLEKLVLKYTYGEEVERLGEVHNRLVFHIKERIELPGCNLAPNKNLEQYINCLWILSFCFFFNTPTEDVKRIAQHIPFTGNDRLTDFLIKASDPDYQVTASKLAFPDIYQPLMDSLSLLHEPEAYNQRILQFLDGYYPGLKQQDVTWHDSHKEADPEFCSHFGYWIFETAALMVFTRCDDSPFREHPFYPADLVDWKKAQGLK